MGTVAADAIIVRPATPHDEDAVDRLLEASYGALLPAGYDDATLAIALPRITKAVPELLSCGTWYVVEAPAGGLLGCGGWSAQRPGTDETRPALAHMRHFATHPDALRRGVGRAIVQRCFDDARAAGVARFECYSSIPAEPFYASFGFERVGIEAIPLGEGVTFPSVVMRLDAPWAAGDESPAPRAPN